MNYEREIRMLEDVVTRFFIGTSRGSTFEEFYTFMDKKSELFRSLSTNGVMLAGGAVTSILTNAKVNDLDFYLNNYDIEKRNYIIELFKSYGFREDFKSDNAITFKRKSEKSNRVYTVQLITRFAGTPEYILDTFDFTIVQGIYDFLTQRFILGARFLPDNLQRRLVFTSSSKFPICAMYRTLKYQKRGYHLSGATIMHISLAIVQLKIENYGQLKEQLMGIDTLYLQNLLEAKSPELPVDYGAFIDEAFQVIDGVGRTLAELEDEEIESSN